MSNVEKQAYIDANNALLTGGWDNIELPPEFANFPSGLYSMTIESMTHDAAEGFIAVKMSLQGVIEVPESDIPVPAEGSLFYTRYSLARKGNALGDFRRAFEAVGNAIGATNPAEFIEQAAGTEVVVELRARRDKQDATRIYNDVRFAYTVDQYNDMLNSASV